MTIAAGPRFAGTRAIAFALAVVVLQILINLAGFGVVAPAILGTELAFVGSARELLAVVVLLGLGSGLSVGLALCTFGRLSLADLGWRTPTLADVGAGVAGFGVCALVLAGTTAAAGGAEALHELLGALGGYTPAQRLLFVMVGVGVAFMEESIFRGYLQPSLCARLGRAGGVVLGAAIFSAYHLHFRPASLGVKFAFGVVFGVLRLARGSLVAPATAHALVWTVLGVA